MNTSGGGLREALIPVLAAALVAAAGCQDASVPTSSSAPDAEADAATRPAASWQASERGRPAVELTRLVARAFGDRGLRMRVKNDMRNAPYLEHKLEFSSYLKGKKGGILLAKMAQHSERSKDGVLDLLERLDPLELEFYMPWDEHRASWTGGADVIIASQFDEGERPAAFTTGGERYDLKLEDLEGTPDRPVLALVPAETDYDDPLRRAAYRNTRDKNGKAIGVYRRAEPNEMSTFLPGQDEASGSDPDETDWADRPPGLYMFDNWIKDLGEGGLKGDPELEAHLQAPTPSSPNTLQRIQCAGQEEPGTFHFNQNSSFFEGPVRVATMEQFGGFEESFGTEDGMNVVLVEDDDTTCKIKMDDGRFEDFLQATAQAAGLVDAIARGETSLGEFIAEGAPAVVRDFVNATANFIETADDPVGVIVEGANVCAPDGEHRDWLIQKENRTNGCTEMRMNDG